MSGRRFSAAEVAALSGIPLPTLTFFLREGILEPSVQRASGRGRGHVFDFTDLVAATTLNALRIPNAGAGPLRHLVRFWRSDEGRSLVETLRSGRSRPKPHLVLVTERGVETDMDPARVMAKHKTPVVFCLDVARYVDDLNVASTETLMRVDFLEPGKSGRVPPRRSIKSRRRASPERRKRRRD